MLTAQAADAEALTARLAATVGGGARMPVGAFQNVTDAFFCGHRFVTDWRETRFRLQEAAVTDFLRLRLSVTFWKAPTEKHGKGIGESRECPGETLVVMAGIQPLRKRMDNDRQPGSPISAHPRAMLKPLWKAVRERTSREIMIAGLLLSMIFQSLVGYLVSYLNIELGFSLVVAGLACSPAGALKPLVPHSLPHLEVQDCIFRAT